MSTLSLLCRYGKECKNINNIHKTCQFRHLAQDIQCKFGTSCRRGQECRFSHPNHSNAFTTSPSILTRGSMNHDEFIRIREEKNAAVDTMRKMQTEEKIIKHELKDNIMFPIYLQMKKSQRDAYYKTLKTSYAHVVKVMNIDEVMDTNEVTPRANKYWMSAEIRLFNSNRTILQTAHCLIPNNDELKDELLNNKSNDHHLGIFILAGANISHLLYHKETQDISPVDSKLPKLVKHGFAQGLSLGKRYRNIGTPGIIVPISWFWRSFSGFDPNYYYPSITSSQDVIQHIDKNLPSDFPSVIIDLVSTYVFPSIYLGQDLTDVMSISDFKCMSYQDWFSSLMSNYPEGLRAVLISAKTIDISEILISRADEYFKILAELQSKIQVVNIRILESEKQLKFLKNSTQRR